VQVSNDEPVRVELPKRVECVVENAVDGIQGKYVSNV